MTKSEVQHNSLYTGVGLSPTALVSRAAEILTQPGWASSLNTTSLERLPEKAGVQKDFRLVLTCGIPKTRSHQRRMAVRL
jgi:hypothetical protein